MSEFKRLEEITRLFNSLPTHKEGTLEHRTVDRNIKTTKTGLKNVISRLSKKSSTGNSSAADTPLQAETQEPNEIIINLAGLMILEEPDEKRDFWRRLLRDNKEIFENAKLKKAEFLEFLKSKPDVFQEEPVVSAPVLSEVSVATIRLELCNFSKSVLSALYALLTGIGVTSILTKCDNQQREWIQDTINQVRSGEIPTSQNQKTHRAFQHCRNCHQCQKCRAICAILSICRFGGNPEIDKQVCRSVWYGSPFAEQAMRRLLILKLGPICALAQVVGNPESPHREMLAQILCEMNVQETAQERELRQQEDETNKQSEQDEFKKHDWVEGVLDRATQRADLAVYDLGYDPCKILGPYI